MCTTGLILFLQGAFSLAYKVVGKCAQEVFATWAAVGAASTLRAANVDDVRSSDVIVPR